MWEFLQIHCLHRDFVLGWAQQTWSSSAHHLETFRYLFVTCLPVTRWHWQPAGGREAEGDDLQHLQLRLRPEGKGWRGGRQVITFSQDLIQSIGCFCAQILMNFAKLKTKLNLSTSRSPKLNSSLESACSSPSLVSPRSSYSDSSLPLPYGLLQMVILILMMMDHDVEKLSYHDHDIEL